MITRLADSENSEGPGCQSQLHFVAGKTSGRTAEQQLEMLCALERCIRKRNF